MNDPRDEDRQGDFHGILARVMIVQVIALLVLWLLQARYTAG